jgi:hypothetical protein
MVVVLVGGAIFGSVVPAAAIGHSAVKRAANRAIKDCVHDGKIRRHYRPRVLRYAIHHLPTDVDEYTPCRTVLRRALTQARRRAARH